MLDLIPGLEADLPEEDIRGDVALPLLHRLAPGLQLGGASTVVQWICKLLPQDWRTR